jgi:membrane-associated phospholipid phosphatase
VWAPASALAAVAIAVGLSKIVERSRPFVAIPTAHVLVTRSTDFGFPSDHSTAAGAITVGLLLAGARIGDRRIGRVTAVLAVLLAFSRVYVGVHYPGDVLAGLVLGGVVAAAGLPLFSRVAEPLARKLLASPAAPLLVADPAVALR